ncbi:MAG: hypothetical protein JO345_01270 [Streptosporangiaceae bacterium]|nr:hypothetical protein [Streptosporangiaceae bacterium]
MLHAPAHRPCRLAAAPGRRARRARAAGGAFNSGLSLPGTDSQAAVSLLAQHYPAAAGETDQVVIQAAGGATIRSPQVRDPVTKALARVSGLPGIASVTSPYTAAGAAQISRDGTAGRSRKHMLVGSADRPAAAT